MGDNFARAVSRQAVAQIAISVGCQEAYPSVLDTLADLARDFILSVGREAQAKCEAEGRTHISVLDMQAALEFQQPFGRETPERLSLDFRSLKNFAFRESDPLKEAATDEIMDQSDKLQWCQPFPTKVEPFPVRKRPRLPPSGWLPGQCAADAGTRPSYVPPFLPPFPPEHTYRRTAKKAVVKMKDPVDIQRRRIDTKQHVQRALRRLADASAASAAAKRARGAGGGTPKKPGVCGVGWCHRWLVFRGPEASGGMGGACVCRVEETGEAEDGGGGGWEGRGGGGDGDG